MEALEWARGTNLNWLFAKRGGLNVFHQEASGAKSRSVWFKVAAERGIWKRGR